NFKKISTFEKFENELLLKAQGLNTFCNPLNPLQYKELKATARSIARWTWKNFDSHTFSLIQSSRGAKNKNKPKKSNVKEMLGFIGGEK
ncbi:replication initiation protein, partial [Escherichia coli]